MDWGDQSLVPNIGEDARAEDDVKEFNYCQLEFAVCIFYHFINNKGLFWVEAFKFCPIVHSTKLKNLVGSGSL